jgi:hemolysin D
MLKIMAKSIQPRVEFRRKHPRRHMFLTPCPLGLHLGEVDIVASAPGKIIPSGRTKVIQPFETGVVRAIHVRDGQGVHAGEVLIELDPTMNEAERNHLRSDLTSAQLDAARLTAALRKAADPVAEFRPRGRRPILVTMQRQLLASQESEFAAKIELATAMILLIGG